MGQAGPERLQGIVTGADAPVLPGMSEAELTAADTWATGISPGRHPVQFIRDLLDRLGVVPAAQLSAVEDGTRIRVAGVVTHRQRPATPKTFDDRTGVDPTGRHSRCRRAAHNCAGLE